MFIPLTDVRSVGFDLPCSGDGRILHHCDVIRLHKPIRLLPIPPALYWNQKMPANVPVDDGGDLIVLISVVRQCHCTTACHNAVDCFQACTAHAASGTDISMQDVVLVVPSPKSLVLSSHHQSLSHTRKVRCFQSTKGLFHIKRRLLSETAILTVHRLRLHDRTRRELLHMRKCLASICGACSKTQSDATVALPCRLCDMSSLARSLRNCAVKRQAMLLIEYLDHPESHSYTSCIYESEQSWR